MFMKMENVSMGGQGDKRGFMKVWFYQNIQMHIYSIIVTRGLWNHVWPLKRYLDVVTYMCILKGCQNYLKLIKTVQSLTSYYNRNKDFNQEFKP